MPKGCHRPRREVSEGIDGAVRDHVENILEILDVLGFYAEGHLEPYAEASAREEGHCQSEVDALRTSIAAVVADINLLA